MWLFIALQPFTVLSKAPSPKIENGIVDLREWEFRTDGSVELDGEWEFYWEQLFFSEDFDLHKPDTVHYREFTKLWNYEMVGKDKISPEGYATYRARVILSSITPELTLSIPHFYSAYFLLVNGEFISANGHVGISEETSVPHWQLITHDLKVKSDTLDIVLQVSNFRHARGGARYPIVIGEKVYMQTHRKREEANDLIMAASLFFIGLFFMILYWFGRHEKHILFYSLFCFFFSYRAIGSGNYVLHSLQPDLPWLLTVKFEYVTTFLSALFFCFYSYYLYKKETSRVFLSFATVFFSVCVLLALFAPVTVFTHVVAPFSVFVSVSFFYLLYTYIIAVLNNRNGSRLSLVSSLVLFGVVIMQILEYFGAFEVPMFYTFIGFQQFYFVQSIILFNRYSRNLELAKEKAEEAAKSQSDFLSMISHEIRTPLNAVIGLTNFLISDKPKKDHEEDLRTLRFSAEHLHILINDVLDYSKLESGKIEFDLVDTNIIELAKNIIKGFEKKAEEKSIYLNFICDDDIPKFVICDGLRLSQVLTNLIGNAIKFTNKGGVTLSLAIISRNEKKVSIKFIVEDSGIGIPKEKQAKIFDSFSQASTSTTRKYGGTGLGLSITKKILAMQNIKINLFSIEGQGSRFYFTQPFTISEEQEHSTETIKKDEHDLKGVRILLVEDNPVNVMVAKKFLSRWDIEVDLAENGREAVEKVSLNVYDIILMDLQMPIMDGYTASKELRKNGVEIPILALTASVMLDVGDKVFKAGMDDYITKPFDPNDLYNKILIHLGKKEPPLEGE